MATNEKNVINGKYGRVKINGYEMLIVESVSVDMKIDRETIKGTGKHANKKVYRETDSEISGKLTVKMVSNMGMREYVRQLKKGIDNPVLIELFMEDPNQVNGQIESASFEAYFTDMNLIGWENGSFVEKEFSFNVDPSTFDYDSVIDGDDPALDME